MKPVIIIPAYNPPKSFISLLQKIRNISSIPIIIIDDGSIPIIKVENVNTILLRNKNNSGKGFSLIRGFNEALDRGFSHAITMDADSQHDPNILQSDLLKVPTGDITYNGVKENIKVGVQYVEAWLRGNGCVPLYNLMEDAATAEISRSQLWQWLHNNVTIEGDKFTENKFDAIIIDECRKIEEEIGKDRYNTGKFALAVDLFSNMIKKDEFDEFLTLPAYKFI